MAEPEYEVFEESPPEADIAMSAPPAVSPEGFTTVTVHYGTDRNDNGPTAAPNDRFGNDRFIAAAGEAAVQYGTCDVSIPLDHQVGELEDPDWPWQSEDPREHVVTERGRDVMLLGRFSLGLSHRINPWFELNYGVSVQNAAYNIGFDTVPHDGSTLSGDSFGAVPWLAVNFHAPNGMLYAVDLNNPGREHWRVIIEEREESVLKGVSLAKGMLVASYQKDVTSRFERFTLEGASLGELELPGLGSAFITTRAEKIDTTRSPIPRPPRRCRMTPIRDPALVAVNTRMIRAMRKTDMNVALAPNGMMYHGKVSRTIARSKMPAPDFQYLRSMTLRIT